MGGSTKKVDTTPQQTVDVRKQLIDYMMGGGQSGANGGAMGGLSRIGAGPSYQPGQVGVQQAGDINTMFQGGPQLDRSMIGNVAGGGAAQQVGTQFDPMQVQTAFQGGGFGPMARAQQVGALGQAPNVQTAFQGGGMAPQAQTQFGTGVDQFQRNQVRDVNLGPGVGAVNDQFSAGRRPQQVQSQFGPTVGAPQQARDVASQGTQSVDQLGGANSAFMQNMLAQNQPLFDQQRQLALAQAKEASGNLTGSGYANALGNSMNRLVPQQQAQLSQMALQGMGMEQARQQQDAGRGLQAQGMNQGADQQLMQQMLQYGQLGQGAQALGLQGQQANQQAGLAAGGQNLQAQGLGLQAQGMNQQAGLQQQGQNLQAQGMNQSADQSFMSQQLGQGGLNLQAQGLGLQGQGMNQGAYSDAASRGLQAQGMGLQGQGMNQQAYQNAAGMNMQGQLANQQAGLQATGQNQQAYQDQAARQMQAQQMGLQGQLANQSAGMQGQQMGLQAQGMNQQSQQQDYARQLQAMLANQGMDANFINQLLQGSGQNLQAQQLGMQAQGTNQQNQQQGYNLAAQLEAQRQSQMGQQSQQQQLQNASIFAQLLGGQATAGVGPSEIVKSGGIGAVLGPLAGIAGSALGGPLGGMIGSQIGGMFGGGGGAVAQGNQLFSNNPQRFGSFF